MGIILALNARLAQEGNDLWLVPSKQESIDFKFFDSLKNNSDRFTTNSYLRIDTQERDESSFPVVGSLFLYDERFQTYSAEIKSQLEERLQRWGSQECEEAIKNHQWSAEYPPASRVIPFPPLDNLYAELESIIVGENSPSSEASCPEETVPVRDNSTEEPLSETLLFEEPDVSSSPLLQSRDDSQEEDPHLNEVSSPNEPEEENVSDECLSSEDRLISETPCSEEEDSKDTLTEECSPFSPQDCSDIELGDGVSGENRETIHSEESILVGDNSSEEPLSESHFSTESEDSNFLSPQSGDDFQGGAPDVIGNSLPNENEGENVSDKGLSSEDTQFPETSYPAREDSKETPSEEFSSDRSDDLGIILALHTPRAGKYNCRWLVTSDQKDRKDTFLQDRCSEIDNESSTSPGIKYEEMVTQETSSREQKERLFLYAEGYPHYSDTAKSKLDERLRQWFEQKREGIIKNYQWSEQSSKSMVVHFSPLDNLFAELKEIIASEPSQPQEALPSEEPIPIQEKSTTEPDVSNPPLPPSGDDLPRREPLVTGKPSLGGKGGMIIVPRKTTSFFSEKLKKFRNLLLLVVIVSFLMVIVSFSIRLFVSSNNDQEQQVHSNEPIVNNQSHSSPPSSPVASDTSIEDKSSYENSNKLEDFKARYEEVKDSGDDSELTEIVEELCNENDIPYESKKELIDTFPKDLGNIIERKINETPNKTKDFYDTMINELNRVSNTGKLCYSSGIYTDKIKTIEEKKENWINGKKTSTLEEEYKWARDQGDITDLNVVILQLCNHSDLSGVTQGILIHFPNDLEAKYKVKMNSTKSPAKRLEYNRMMKSDLQKIIDTGKLGNLETTYREKRNGIEKTISELNNKVKNDQ